MKRSHKINTIPESQRGALYAEVERTESHYESEYPGFECSIEIIESDPHDGRIAFRLNAPDGCGNVSERELVDFESLGVVAMDAVSDGDVREHPYVVGDADGVWVETASAIRWHVVGDTI
jgi:hypothetical protein